jgi:hypothetical protein
VLVVLDREIVELMKRISEPMMVVVVVEVVAAVDEEKDEVEQVVVHQTMKAMK